MLEAAVAERRLEHASFEGDAEQHRTTREERWIGPPGQELYVREIRPEPSPERRFTVFVHGNTFPAAADFDLPRPGYSLTGYLARRGINCCIYDSRGYGRSYKPLRVEPIREPQKLADLQSVVRHLIRHRGASAIDFVALSSGCNTVAELLCSGELRASSVVFMGPAYLLTPFLAHQLTRIRLMRGLRTFLGRRSNPYINLSRKMIRRRILDGEERLIERRTFDIFFDTAKTGTDGGKKLRTPALSFPDAETEKIEWKPLFDPSGLTAPLLVMRGERDDICDRHSARALLFRVPSPRARLVTFPDRKHDMHLYEDHGDVFDTLHRFLDRRLEGFS
ncbi:MAG: alpha/beta fold hydrolase [Polyangia bacterium]